MVVGGAARTLTNSVDVWLLANSIAARPTATRRWGIFDAKWQSGSNSEDVTTGEVMARN